MHTIKLGLFLPSDNLADAKAASVRAERDGFYSVSTNDCSYSPLFVDEVMPAFKA